MKQEQKPFEIKNSTGSLVMGELARDLLATQSRIEELEGE